MEEADKTDLKREIRYEILKLSEKYAHKRTCDVQKYSSLVVALLTAFIIGLSIYNYASLADFKNETMKRIEEYIGKSNKKPDLVLEADKDIPLEGATIDETVFKRENGNIILRVHFNLRNKGHRLATPIFYKIYQKSPMNSGSKSSDEKDFDFQTGPEQFKGSLPAQASTVVIYALSFPSFKLPARKLPMLVKVYYGEEEDVAKARFFLNISP